MLRINEVVLILGKGSTQESDDTKLTAEAEYSINFTKKRNKICLSLHYSWSNSYLFINGVKIYQLKSNDFELITYPVNSKRRFSFHLSASNIDWFYF